MSDITQSFEDFELSEDRQADDWQTVESALARIAWRRARIAEMQAQAAARIELVNRWLERETTKLQRSIDFD